MRCVICKIEAAFQCQAFAAGILPNPELTANLDPASGGGSEVIGYGLGISYDIKNLIIQPAKVVSAVSPEGRNLVKGIVRRYKRAFDALSKEERPATRR